MPSLPSWERGLKLTMFQDLTDAILVAPFVGAWIEIYVSVGILSYHSVAPFVGAWIEIRSCRLFYRLYQSLPSWERGLKFLISI